MLKLLKGEFNYFKGVLIVVWGFFIGFCLLSPFIVKLDRYRPNGVDFFMSVVAWIVILHLVFVLVRMYFEFRESRIRRFAQLPVSTHTVALARICAPLMFILMNIVVMLICWGILSLVYPEPVTPYGVARALQMSSFSIYYSYDQQHEALSILSPLGVWVLLTVFVRLLTEWQGRTLLIILLGLSLFYSLLLKFISFKLYLIILDLTWSFNFNPTGLFAFLFITPVVIIVLLYIFYRTRRSYVAG